MTWSYLPHTDEDRQNMLSKIGVDSMEKLLQDIPENLRLDRPLDLPKALDERSILKLLQNTAAKNANFNNYTYFLGAGMYDHYIPVVVDSIISRSEFYTAYTQYQPEVAQGYLQALWEYQSMICALTGMQVANASMYDGSTAMAEAAMMAVGHTKRKKVVISSTVHPHYQSVLNAYMIDLDVEVDIANYSDGTTDIEKLQTQLNKDVAAVIIQTPNFFGSIEDVKKMSDLAHQSGIVVIVVTDPISLALLEAPGKLGADIVVGEGQPLGISASFGGPGVGFFATTSIFMRKMPGRIVGQTVDDKGRRGFVLTLQAREQHIRREKATSNICSNQALCALAAAVYLSTVGKEGLVQIADLNLQKAHYAYEQITALKGFDGMFSAPFFKEFVIKMPKNIDVINKELLKHNIVGGLDLGRYYKELKDCMLICVTENRTKEEIDTLVQVLGGLK